LHIIAQKADGALRDALSIFDRIVSSVPAEKSGRIITYEHVIENLNVLDYDYFFKVLDAMLIESVSEVMLIFDDILKKGIEPDIFINGFSEQLRDLLVCKDPQTLSLLEVSDTLKKRYSEQAQLTPASFILTALNIANECDVNFKMARNKRLHVEMALIKMTFIHRAIKLANQTADVPVAATAGNPPAPAPEKKTPDTNEPIVTKQKVVKNDMPQTVVREDMPKKVVQKAEPQSQSEQITTATGFDTPKLLDLSELEKELDDEDVDTPVTEAEISPEQFQEAWNKYAEQIKSPSSRTTISKAELELQGNTVKVTVGSVMAKEMVQQEGDLMQFLRDQLGRPDLLMEIFIDPEKLPEEARIKPKKILSTKEKYDKMLQVNPLIDEMRKRFDLKPDYD